MFTITDRNIKQVIKICSMYYKNDMSQQEIADIIGISRSQVCKILLEAKRTGLVTFQINDPNQDISDLETKLIDRYNLKYCSVSRSNGSSSSLITNTAESLNIFLENLVKDGFVIGVGSGSTLSSISEYIKPVSASDVQIVPLTGGGLEMNNRNESNMNTIAIGNGLGCEYKLFKVPGFLQNDDLKRMLEKEKSVIEIRNLWQKCDVALMSIGILYEKSSLSQSGYLSDSDVDEIHRKKVMGGICNLFYNSKGEFVDYQAKNRMMGINESDLLQIPKRVGIALGTQKAKAAKVAIEHDIVNYLFTDYDTAIAILEE